MNIQEVINILQKKIVGLEKQKTFAEESGNLTEIVRLEEEIAETKATIEKIKSNL